MSSPVVAIAPGESLARARNLMLRYKINRVVVEDRGRPLGVLTSTDLVRAMLNPSLSRKAFDEIPAKAVMSSPVITVSEKTDVRYAARLMLKNNVGTLPVVDQEGKLVGIFTRTDAVKAYADGEGEVKQVIEVADRSPPTVSPFHSIYRVLEAMEEKPYHKVVVIEGRKPLGVIAKRDVLFLDLRSFTSGPSYLKRETPLEKGRTGGLRIYLIPLAIDLMSESVITALLDEDTRNASRRMIEKGVGCLPIVKGEELVGLFTKHDVLRLLVAS
ncbi:MAG: CBS domain-containing protein [Fervidicoccaceae archaeon]